MLKKKRAVLVQELLPFFLFRNSIFYYYLLFSFTLLPSKTYICNRREHFPLFFRVLFYWYNFAINSNRNTKEKAYLQPYLSQQPD